MNRPKSSPQVTPVRTNKVISLASRRPNESPQPIAKDTMRWVTVLVVTLICLGASYRLWGAYEEQQLTQEALVIARERHAQAVEDNRLVQHEVQRLHSQAYLAQIARRDYYYSSSDEIIFHLEDVADDNIFETLDAATPEHE